MKLTRNQFNVLSRLAVQPGDLRQGQRKRTGDTFPEAFGETAQELAEAGLLVDGRITNAGVEALEPYRVKRAVFLAAGIGSRMASITINTPKPLIRVHGKRLIDRSIEACLEAGIEEIYIVRGYLAEQFDQLLGQYPMIRFVENPFYDEANNISSALVARNLLENAYVLESDLLIRNSKIIQKYQYTSNFLAFPKKHSDDWFFKVRDGIIVEETFGGEDGWQMVGISYWNEAAGRSLSKDIPDAYGEPGGKDKYWEHVPLVLRRTHYSVEVRECAEEDVAEIDTLEELRAIDPSYNV